MVLVTPKQAAQETGVSVQTLRRWVDEGKLAEHRTAGGHRRYDLDELRRLAAREQLNEPTGLFRIDDLYQLPPGVVPLGSIQRPGENEHFVGMHNDDLDHHLFFCGRTGSGKSELMKWQIVGVARSGYPLFLIDPHGALADATVDALIAHVPDRAEDIIFLDLGDEDHPVAFNPLDVADVHEIDDAITSVMAGLSKELGDAPRAANLARQGLRALCEANLLLPPGQKANLLHLATFFLDVEFRQLIVTCATNASIREMFDPDTGHFEQLSDKARGEQVHPLIRALQPFSNSRVYSEVLRAGENQLRFATWAAQGKIVLIKQGRLSHQALTGEFLGAIMLMSLLTDLDTHLEHGGARVFIEEAPALIGPDSGFLPLMAAARKRNIGLILSSQEPWLFDEQVLKATLANTSSKLSLTLDFDSAEAIARSLSQGSGLVGAGDIASLPYYSFYGNVMTGADQERLMSGPFRTRGLPPLEAHLDEAGQARRSAIIAASHGRTGAEPSSGSSSDLKAALTVRLGESLAFDVGPQVSFRQTSGFETELPLAAAEPASAGSVRFSHTQGVESVFPFGDRAEEPPVAKTATGDQRAWRVRLTFADGSTRLERALVSGLGLALPTGGFDFTSGQAVVEGECYGLTFAEAVATLLTALAAHERLPELLRLERLQ